MRLFKLWHKNEEELDEQAIDRYYEIARIKAKIAALRSELGATANVRSSQKKPKVIPKEIETETKDIPQRDIERERRNAEMNDLKAKLMGKK